MTSFIRCVRIDELTASRTIHANCDNLDAMIGRSICVTLVHPPQIFAIIAMEIHRANLISPPGYLTYDATPLNITKIASM